MTRYMHFWSDRFKPDLGEDEEVNPGIYGKKLATWISEELAKSGIKTNRMYPEDWGWEIDISTDKINRYIGVRNIDDTDDEWVVIIDIRNKMIKKLLGKSQNEDNEIEKILNELETILRNEESIREIDTNYKL
jgi:hypothetical protein